MIDGYEPNLSQTFCFKNCGLGFRVYNGVGQFLIMTASITLAYKYQLAAQDMESYVQGIITNVNSLRN